MISTDGDDDTTNDMTKDVRRTDTGPRTQYSLAVKTLSEKGIILVPEMGAFMVKGSGGNKYAVTLFPSETCSCPATSRCYHIITAMLSIGMNVPNERKTYNLTQLRKNVRPKHMKKCGTKKGRLGDNDIDRTIIPAPDSIIKTKNLDDTLYTPTTSVKKQVYSESTPKSLLISNSSSKKMSNRKKRKLQFEEDLTQSKIPKLETDLSTICEENELLELEYTRDVSNEELDDIWIPDLRLTMTDKNDLINNGKLNSNHMEAVNILLRKLVGGSINGLQLTEKVPYFNESSRRWVTKMPFESTTSPSCQIHHNHHDHWVASISYKNAIYLLDSLGNDRPADRIIPNGLKIQLSQLYGVGQSCIDISVPSVMKQNNNVDCGLFAIAFVTSFCVRNDICFDLIYDTAKFRQHLFQCFERLTISEFPITNKRISERRKKKVSGNQNLQLLYLQFTRMLGQYGTV
ncbi:hypothetical protein ACF0H5_017021 [Mactra antiquata]